LKNRTTIFVVSSMASASTSNKKQPIRALFQTKRDLGAEEAIVGFGRQPLVSALKASEGCLVFNESVQDAVYFNETNGQYIVSQVTKSKDKTTKFYASVKAFHSYFVTVKAVRWLIIFINNFCVLIYIITEIRPQRD
jgi:hypothetical protein